MFEGRIIRLSEIASTNDYAGELLRNESPSEGTLITTGFQTSGRGQAGNTWESTANKNILVTAILYPAFLNPEKQFVLTQIVSLSVCTTLDDYNHPHKAVIKWPNDIYVNNRKIAGILIKNNLAGNRIMNTIAGVGLNVNQDVFSSNAPLAVSLRQISGKETDLQEILSKWHENLFKWYSLLKSGGFEAIEEAYLNRLYLLSIPSRFLYKEMEIEATITGTGEYGHLLLKTSDGNHLMCDLKEIVFIPPAMEEKKSKPAVRRFP